MTPREVVYVDALNLFGCTPVEDPLVQEFIDHEHELADPVWGEKHRRELRELEESKKLRALTTGQKSPAPC